MADCLVWLLILQVYFDEFVFYICYASGELQPMFLSKSDRFTDIVYVDVIDLLDIVYFDVLKYLLGRHLIRRWI